MEVILIKDVEKIGRANSVVNVKEGFARNFLFPQKLAKPATGESLKKLQEEKKAYQEKLNKDKEEFLKLREKIQGFSLTISALAQDKEKLYGGINAHDISEALRNEHISVDKGSIELPEPIKALGNYEIKVRLHPEVIANLKLCIVQKSSTK